MKKLVALVLAGILCLSIFVVPAFAGTWYWTRTIIKIQQSTTSTYIVFVDSSNANRMNLPLSTSNTNQMLAIALTAMSLGKAVHYELTSGYVTSIVLSDE